MSGQQWFHLLKLPILVVQKPVTKKWGRIWPEVHWCNQMKSSYGVCQCATSRDIAQLLDIYTQHYKYIHTQKATCWCYSDHKNQVIEMINKKKWKPKMLRKALIHQDIILKLGFFNLVHNCKLTTNFMSLSSKC